MVVGPQEEEVLGGVAVVPGDAGNLDLVQRDGNGAHAVFRQHLPEKAGELLQLHRLVPHDLHKLVQHAAEDLPQLGGLLRLLEAARFGLDIHLAFQSVLKAQLLHEIVEGVHLGGSGLSGLQPLRQAGQGGLDPAAQGVDPGQPRRPGGSPGGPVAVGIFHPVHVPQPHAAVDLPLEDVVFQLVALLRLKARQAGFQPAEHIIVFISPPRRGQDPGEKAEDRLFQNVAAAAEVGGNLPALKHRLDDGLVGFHIAGGHRDVPAAAFSIRQKAADGGGGLLHLGEDGIRLEEADLGGIPVIGIGRAEEMTLQMAQGGAVPAGQRFDVHRLPLPLRQAAEALEGAEGRVENLLPAVRLAQKGDGEGMGLAEEDGKAAAFLGGEVGETVDINILARGVAGGFQAVAELGHIVPRVQAGAEEAGLIGGVEKAQVPELVVRGPGNGLGLLVKGLGRDLVAPQLVKEGQELAEEGGLPGGAAVNRQLRENLQQGFFQGEELAPGVQGHLGRAAGDGEDPVREAAEAQYLGVAAGGVAAGAAKVHLRLVRGVFGHQENLVPSAGAGGDAAKHRRGFAGFGPAG